MANLQGVSAKWSVFLCSVMYVCGLSSAIPSDDTLPKQLRLSFGLSTQDIVIMAATKVNCNVSVQYGKNYFKLDKEAVGRTVVFDQSQMNPDGLHYLHRILIQNLVPGPYFYFVKCGESVSETVGFQIPKNDTNWSPKFLVYGDMGLETDIIPALKAQVQSGDYTAVLHLGDFAYDLESDGGVKGDKFMDMIEPIASKVPYLTTPGNHESAKETYSHYRYRFSTPSTEWPVPLNKMWYSIDIGSVHLVSYNTEVYNVSDKKYIDLQRDWLVQDLTRANKNRRHTPWIIAIAHKPFYCSTIYGDDCNKETFDMRDSLEEVFSQNSVDLILAGHEHTYERLYPTYKGEVTSKNYSNPSSPVTIISGAAGSSHNLDPMTGKPGVWSAFRMTNSTGSMYSYGVLTVKNDTHLYWEQRSSAGSHVIDSFWLVQNHHGSASVAADSTSSWDAAAYLNHVKEMIKSNKGIAIGLTTAFAAFLFLICVCIFLRCRRRRGITRRWEVVDYDKSFYTDVRTEDDDFAFDDPEPNMESNGTAPTAKLLGKANA